MQADDRMEQELQKAQLFAAREAKRGRNTVKRPGIAKKQDKNQLWIQSKEPEHFPVYNWQRIVVDDIL